MAAPSSLATIADHTRAGVAAVAASSLAGERVLPVDEVLGNLFGRPGAVGLVRGQVVHCGGVAPLSLALAVAAEATRAGAWLAVVDVASLGLDAAVEMGVPLERLVAVESGPARNWAEVMGAVADGFELVVTAPQRSVSASMARKVHQRLSVRGVVMLMLGDQHPAAPSELADIELRATSPVWDGLGDGNGHLRARRITISASGRRMPHRRSVDVLLPGPSGRLEAAGGEVIALGSEDLAS